MMGIIGYQRGKTKFPWWEKVVPTMGICFVMYNDSYSVAYIQL